MENATKALLIAASVLIAIVLIAVSINILSSTSGVTNQVGEVSSSMASSVFNSQFSSYFSSSTSGTQARALVQKVIANNQNSSHKVLLYCPDYSTAHIEGSTLSTFSSWISPTARYKIEVFTGCALYSGGYQSDGYIGCILIKKL